MNAVDTNVLVRLLTRDDAEQFSAVSALFAREKIWIAKTVLLETHWVLRSTFRTPEESIRAVFSKLVGLTNVSIEDEPAVLAALALGERGIAFADALHLSSRPPDTAFISFDRVLVRRAQKAGLNDVLHPTVTRP